MDHESVQATALKVVFDLLHVYGFEAFNITSSSSTLDSGSGGGAEEGSQLEQGSPEEEKEKREQGVEGLEGEGHEQEEEEDSTEENYITQRLLNIMASFLEGEVSAWQASLYTSGCMCVCD